MDGRGGLTRTVRTTRLSDIEDEPNRSQVPSASTSGAATDNNDVIPPWAANKIRLLQQLVGKITQMEARADPTHPGQNIVEEQNANVQATNHETWRHMLETFMKMKPPKFSGSADYTVAEDWKENVENLLDAINTRFDLQFFPPSLRQAKAREFLTLKQGSIIVLQYETQFTHLARFATHMHLDEFRMARQFEEGIQDELRLLVKGRFCQSLREVSDLSTYLE
ncbi:hypothetical protein FRX31_022997 [Thalictrum thalictroides]|uniref:Retrotransposon gag domain-containing protein n=1 Tax=Thalictrum thalictroides TaxID=46969 RepID=A0A7J6VQR1_THATH|nr:hypothetical protein FRX31_022997 [Thalictrum thalictroides]